MQDARRPRWLWLVFVIAWLCAFSLHWQRWKQEEAHRSVELVLDFNSLVELARMQGQSWEQLWPEFSRQNIKGLAFSELRLDELENYGICSVYDGVALGADLGTGSGQPPLPDPQRTYVVCWAGAHSALMSPDQVGQALQDTFGTEKVRRFILPHPRLGGSTVWEVGYPLKVAQGVGICLPEWAVQAAEKAGVKVWARPENKPPITREAVDRYLDRLAHDYKLEGIIFGGSSNEVLGYGGDDLEVLKETAATIQRYGWKLGFIELPKATQQKGVETLVRALPLQTVRVFAVPPAQQEKLKPERVAQMYGLAARERNLTVLYLRPYAYDPSPDKGFENATQKMLTQLNEDLGDRISTDASTFTKEVVVPPWLAAPMAAGGMAAGLLVLSTYLPIGSAVAGTAVLGFAVLTGVLAATKFAHLWLSLVALGTACGACALAVVSQFPALRAAARAEGFRSIFGLSVRAWLTMSLVSLMGAWLASSFLQETSYKLGLDIFRGVKVLTVLTPLAITAAWMLEGDERSHWLAIGGASLKLYQLVGLGLLAVGGIFYTMRTGNMGGEVGGDALEAEKYVRMVLDQSIGVRPRFKEFLLAHPAMLIVPFAIRFGWRELAAVLLLVGSLGQCGLLDTFAHVHTPLKISLIRALLGLLFGGALGFVYAFVFWKIARRVQKHPELST